MEWFREMTSKSEGVYGLPEQYAFHYPKSLWKIGFWQWMASDFKYMPTQDEVGRYDPRWISDMQLAYTIYRFYANKDQKFQIMENAAGRTSFNTIGPGSDAPDGYSMKD